MSFYNIRNCWFHIRRRDSEEKEVKLSQFLLHRSHPADLDHRAAQVTTVACRAECYMLNIMLKLLRQHFSPVSGTAVYHADTHKTSVSVSESKSKNHVKRRL